MRAFWNKINYSISVIDHDAVITTDSPDIEIIEIPEEHRHALSYYKGEYYYRLIYISWQEVREIRNQKLFSSDYTQLKDYTKPDQQKWAEYRQKLRDLPTQFNNPEDVIFPIDPTIP